ncbi:MAG: hypothetical protein IRZ33_11025 [Alicyclobacillaceae bacterium]|nr:hypothetical protein [Alicyclobacillaceae bacterium]
MAKLKVAIDIREWVVDNVEGGVVNAGQSWQRRRNRGNMAKATQFGGLPPTMSTGSAEPWRMGAGCPFAASSGGGEAGGCERRKAGEGCE